MLKVTFQGLVDAYVIKNLYSMDKMIMNTNDIYIFSTVGIITWDESNKHENVHRFALSAIRKLLEWEKEKGRREREREERERKRGERDKAREI